MVFDSYMDVTRISPQCPYDVHLWVFRPFWRPTYPQFFVTLAFTLSACTKWPKPQYWTFSSSPTLYSSDCMGPPTWGTQPFCATGDSLEFAPETPRMFFGCLHLIFPIDPLDFLGLPFGGYPSSFILNCLPLSLPVLPFPPPTTEGFPVPITLGMEQFLSSVSPPSPLT